MKYTLISLVLLLNIGNTVNGQSLNKHELDSLRRQLQHCSSDSQRAFLKADISLQMAEAYPDSALAMAREGAVNATAAGSKDAYADCLESIGWTWFKKGEPDSAEYYLTRSMSLFHMVHDKWGESHAMMNLTTVYDYSGNNEKVLDICLQAVKLMEGLKDTLGKAYTELRIADSYRKQGLNDKAMPYLQDAIPIFRKLHQDAFLAGALLSQGEGYVETRQYDAAFPKFREAAEAYRRADFTAGEAAAMERIGHAFTEKSNEVLRHPWTDSALYYDRLSYALYSTTGESIGTNCEKMAIGENLVLLGKYDEAIRDLEESLQFFIKYKSPNYAYEATHWLSKVSKLKGDYRRAVDFMEQSAVFKDSVDATNRRETMASMFARYETDKKDKAIQLLNAQKALADKELSRNKVIELFSFCLLVLMVALAIILRKQARIRHQLKEVGMRNQIAGDLHDDIGSSLSSILLLSNMATNGMGQHESRSALDKIRITAREVMEKMSDIVWTMNPQHDEGVSIKERIEKLALQVRDVSSLQMQVDISDRVEALIMPMDLRKNIFLICKEALNNILKHAGASHVIVTMDIVHRNI